MPANTACFAEVFDGVIILIILHPFTCPPKHPPPTLLSQLHFNDMLMLSLPSTKHLSFPPTPAGKELDLHHLKMQLLQNLKSSERSSRGVSEKSQGCKFICCKHLQTLPRMAFRAGRASPRVPRWGRGVMFTGIPHPSTGPLLWRGAPGW